MNRAQHYIGAMLESVAEGRIGSDQNRLTFAKIKEKLANAEDFESELKNLYKVTGFADLAIRLLWIAERVESDPLKTAHSPEEQEMIVLQFRLAVGDEGPVFAGEAPGELASPEPEAGSEVFGQSAEPESERGSEAFGQSAEPETELSSEAFEQSAEPEDQAAEVPAEELPQMETTGPIDDSGAAALPAGSESGTEGEFSTMMEKFVEAMQSGSDDRESLLSSVMNQCNAMIPENSGAPDDLREFSRLLVEFLNYITENGFMDDVRVMNILSNVSGPMASWAQSSPGERAGVLEEALEILRTFKSLFE